MTDRPSILALLPDYAQRALTEERLASLRAIAAAGKRIAELEEQLRDAKPGDVDELLAPIATYPQQSPWLDLVQLAMQHGADGDESMAEFLARLVEERDQARACAADWKARSERQRARIRVLEKHNAALKGHLHRIGSASQERAALNAPPPNHPRPINPEEGD